METTNEQKLVDAIMNGKNVDANKQLEKILKKKVANKIANALNQ